MIQPETPILECSVRYTYMLSPIPENSNKSSTNSIDSKIICVHTSIGNPGSKLDCVRSLFDFAVFVLCCYWNIYLSMPSFQWKNPLKSGAGNKCVHHSSKERKYTFPFLFSVYLNRWRFLLIQISFRVSYLSCWGSVSAQRLPVFARYGNSTRISIVGLSGFLLNNYL